MKIKQGRFFYLDDTTWHSVSAQTQPTSTLLKLFRSHKEKASNLARGLMTIGVGGQGGQVSRSGPLCFL